MQQYRHFGQGESGVFSRADAINDLIGTANVGPCIVLFLHNPKAKDCYAIHFDDRIHFTAIKQQITKYIASIHNTTNLRAFLIGGWGYFKAGDSSAAALLSWLQYLEPNNIENILYKKNGSPRDTRRVHYYDHVVFDVNRGRLHLEQAPILRFSPGSDRFITHKADCFQYIRNNAIPLSDSIENIKLYNAGISSDQEAINFFKIILEENNGTPIIPAINFGQEYAQQLLRLAGLAKKGDALDTIKYLYDSFANPSSIISNFNRNTPLHYACSELRFFSGDYEREVIVLLMLLHAHRDLPDSNGKAALSLLPNSSFKTKCEDLLIFIKQQNTPVGVNYQFVKQYRDVTACLAGSIIQYRKSPGWVKAAIHNQLTEYFKKLFVVPLPRREPTNLTHIVLFLGMMFLLYRILEIDNPNNDLAYSTLTKHAKRMIL